MSTSAGETPSDMLAEPLEDNAEGVTSIEVETEYEAYTVSESSTESLVSEDQAEIDITRYACFQQCDRVQAEITTPQSIFTKKIK